MNVIHHALALTAVLIASHATAQVTFYENSGFEGQSFTTQRNVNNLERFGFNNRASSAVVRGNATDRWEVCDDVRFGGRCVVLRRGQYSSLSSMGLNDRVTSVRNVARNAQIDEDRYAPAPVAPSPPEVTFFENDSYQGRSFSVNSPVVDLRRSTFNDRASSAVVRSGRWEVCDDASYRGQCVVLRPGQYAALSDMGLNNRVSSVRAVDSNARVDDGRYAPMPVVSTDYGRRNNEQLYQANVTSVRAVVDAPIMLHDADRMLWDVVWPGSTPDRALTPGERLSVGGHEITVLHTPGHSPGCCSFHDARADAVFSGDTLFCGGPGATGRSHSDEPTILRSIRTTLLALPDHTIVHTGHGDSTTIGAERAGVLARAAELGV